MKKILLGIALSVLVLQGCKKDEEEAVAPTTVVADTTDEQNAWDDTSIAKFLDEHYLDSKGNVVAFDSTITTDDTEKKLSAYESLVKLASGVIVIKRDAVFQPDPGKTINTDDAISIMQNTLAYVGAKNTETGVISLTGGVTFSNTIAGSGVPVFDPSYYYVKESVLKSYNATNSTTYGTSFFQIEGLSEGLKYFKSFDLDNSANYNLQGVIIVPSRAAFARDVHYPYSNFNWQNRTFVFNFQIYKTKTRTEAGN